MEVTFTAAIFDLQHRGHLNLLRYMRSKSDKVIVVIHDDLSCFKIKGKFPIQTTDHRKQNILLTGLVDEVIVTCETDPAKEFEQILEKYPNAKFIRGDDNLTPPGKWLLDERNIPQEYIKYTEGVSSTLIRQELCNF